jgi:spore coat protein H
MIRNPQTAIRAALGVVVLLVLGIGTFLYLQSTTTPIISNTAPEAQATTVTVESTEASHSNDAEPNYAVVFPDDQVNQLTITISPENWAIMQADMTAIYGEAGTEDVRDGGGGFGGPRNGQPPTAEGTPNANQQPPEGGFPQGGGIPGGGVGGLESDVNPVWVESTIEFNGETWNNVGIRYKGNSSLRSLWSSGALNLPFKLDFDEFEDTYPEITNQRFYGFKQLSLNNNFGDSTYMRETVAYDLLEEAGLVAANTAIYEIVLDYGEGDVSLGLYTVVELVDDTVVKRYFGDDKGNIYKPSGDAATLADGTYAQISDAFDKENNDTEADWSNIEEFYTVLHSDVRTTDPQAWRAELESIFNVDGFLKWLALSTMIEHWDTYGGMAHNYYLYHNPETDLIEWISWDHNFILGATAGGGGGDRGGFGEPPAGFPETIPTPEGGMPEGMPELPEGVPGGRGGGFGGSRNSSLDKADVTEQWPLIRYLLDDPTYHAAYLGHLEALNGTVFNAEALAEKYQSLAALIAPYTETEAGTETFQSAVQALTERTYERAEAINEFLATQ